MMLQIANVLSPDVLATHVNSLRENDAVFSSGKATAGWHAKDIKHNDQASGDIAGAVMDDVRTHLLGNALFVSAARPKSFVKTLVSRYRPGMHYGSHVDNALMGGMRTDLSFTLFLSEPDTYDGGELVLEEHSGDTAIKLPAGSMILYPTTSLHRVTEVTRGERMVLVGWVRSYIRNPEQREVLFDLDQIVATLKATAADRGLMNSTLKLRNTLTRMWVED